MLLGCFACRYVQRAVRLKEAASRWFFQQLIIGLDYCHRRGVVNRDIKLENTLLQVRKTLLREYCVSFKMMTALSVFHCVLGFLSHAAALVPRCTSLTWVSMSCVCVYASMHPCWCEPIRPVCQLHCQTFQPGWGSGFGAVQLACQVAAYLGTPSGLNPGPCLHVLLCCRWSRACLCRC